MKNQLIKREVLNEKWIEPSYINESGNIFWYNKYGELHSTGDWPAVMWPNKDKHWYKNGQLHRDGDKPAAIYSNGGKCWYKNGKRHRDGDKPAVTHPNGTKWWYKNGKVIKSSLQ